MKNCQMDVVSSGSTCVTCKIAPLIYGDPGFGLFATELTVFALVIALKFNSKAKYSGHVLFLFVHLDITKRMVTKII